MSKRARAETESPATAPSPNGKGVRGSSDLESLATWCDEKLRMAAASCRPQDVHREKGDAATALDEDFDEFVDELREDMHVAIDEERKGGIADVWRRIGEDALRAHALLKMTSSDSDVRENFYTERHATEALDAMHEACIEHGDSWFFNLGWDLATAIMQGGGRDVDSESDDSDPVEESESEDGEESESGSGSESESGSESK